MIKYEYWESRFSQVSPTERTLLEARLSKHAAHGRSEICFNLFEMETGSKKNVQSESSNQKIPEENDQLHVT